MSRPSIPEIALHSSWMCIKLFSWIYPISLAMIAWVKTSADEPLAMLLGMETEALRIWSLKLKSFANFPFSVILYTYTARSFARCQTFKFRNFPIYIVPQAVFLAPGTVSPKPYTLHPVPFFIFPTPYTVLYTLYLVPYTVNRIPYALYRLPYTFYLIPKC